jgi:carbonic anhydrase
MSQRSNPKRVIMILGSIEYAVGHLGTPLVMVLGHSGCGAVKATLADTPVEGHAVSIAAAIQPSVDSSRGEPGDHVDNTARANARRMADQLKASEPVLALPVGTGKVAVVAAFYRLDTGMVEIL